MILVVLNLRKPLKSIAGPVNRMQEEKVVKIWRLFLPDFILLVNYHLFFLVKLYVQAWLPSAMINDNSQIIINFIQWRASQKL